MKSEKGEPESELMEIALTKLKIAAVLANNARDQLNQQDIERIAHCITSVTYNLQWLRNKMNI